MKKTFVAISLLSTFAAYAQVSPTQNHQSTVLTSSEAKDVWKTMRTDFMAGSECFNRAQSWTYDVNDKYGYEAKKILIHYSYKYNQELSSKWGFHIAPMYNVNGKDIVFDKGFQPWLHAPVTPKMWEEKFLIAGTEKLVEKRIKLKEKINKLIKAINKLDKSSEFYWEEYKSKQSKLKELKAEMVEFGVTDADLKKQRPKKIASLENGISFLAKEMKKFSRTSSTFRSLENQYKYKVSLLKKVKSDLDYAAHIECKKIDNIEELDYNQNGAWCFIQEVSQYYWGVPQLRRLNYGEGHGMNSLPLRSELPQARREGAQFVHTNDFNMNDVWIARRQAFGPAYKDIWKKEYDLKERSADAVSKIDNVADDLNDELNDAIKIKKKIDKVVNKRSEKLSAYAANAQKYLNIVNENAQFGKDAMSEIYSIAQEISVEATEKKATLYTSSKNKVARSKANVEALEKVLDTVEDKLKKIIKKEKDDAKAEARRERERRRRNRRN